MDSRARPGRFHENRPVFDDFRLEMDGIVWRPED
jgi:hypothetical protein